MHCLVVSNDIRQPFLPINLPARYTFCNGAPCETCTDLIWVGEPEFDVMESCCLLSKILIVRLKGGEGEGGGEEEDDEEEEKDEEKEKDEEEEKEEENVKSRFNVADCTVCFIRAGEGAGILDFASWTWEPCGPIGSISTSGLGSSLDLPLALPLALAHCSKMNKNQIVAMAAAYKQSGVVVDSLTDIFEGRDVENVFHSTALFCEHFERMIEFARILGARKVVFGGAINKHVPISRGAHEFHCYMRAHEIFARVMRGLGEYAEARGVEIVMKPSGPPCNYLFEEQHVEGMVASLDMPNVRVGVLRRGLFNNGDILEWAAPGRGGGERIENALDFLKWFLGLFLF